MNIFEIVASIASIISIPLAIYFARKTSDATSDKARIDIIKTLSYKLSDNHAISRDDIESVYKSKLREHKVHKAKFNQEDILNDLKTDIMSNAFLNSHLRNDILYNISSITFDTPIVRRATTKLDKLFRPFVELFISPLPVIFLIVSIINNIILLCPYVFDLIVIQFIGYRRYLSYFYYELDSPVESIIRYLRYSSVLHVNLIVLLVLSIICIFRKLYLKRTHEL